MSPVMSACLSGMEPERYSLSTVSMLAEQPTSVTEVTRSPCAN